MTYTARGDIIRSMKLTVISSGSRANAAVIQNEGEALLIDCGVSLRALKAALFTCGVGVGDITAVFVTHSHTDHTRGHAALRAAAAAPFYSAADVDMCVPFSGSIRAGGFTVDAFECSHDVPCVGYKITCGKSELCIATDTGRVTDGMRRALSGCKTVVIESNHDVDMLKCGRYPQNVKTRILSDRGHLSNRDCARFLTELAQLGLEHAVLAHEGFVDVLDRIGTPRAAAPDDVAAAGDLVR